MSEEQKVLSVLIENGSFESADPKVGGIAQRAIDLGYETLTGPQKAVLKPFMSRECDGVEDPGG